MNRRTTLFLAVLLCASGAQAEIHKCVADDGATTYSQVPCPQKESDVVRTPVRAGEHVLDCRWASSFAKEVTRNMRAGLAPDAIFDLYGGADAVSPGTVNIINYVFRFRANNSVPDERITSLAHSMCEAGSLGDVRCVSLPYGQAFGSNRCDPDADDSRNAVEQSAVVSLADQNQAQCKKSARDEIDKIDAQMRQGYAPEQAERYRDQLLVLTKRLREC